LEKREWRAFEVGHRATKTTFFATHHLGDMKVGAGRGEFCPWERGKEHCRLSRTETSVQDRETLAWRVKQSKPDISGNPKVTANME